MAWISSESFYRRLIRSQLHNVAQLEQQDPMASKSMQNEIEALIDERDELYTWKEAHLNERKDSVTRDCEELQIKNRDLETGLVKSRRDTGRLREDNEQLNAIIGGLEDALRKSDNHQKSFEELRAAHERLKKANSELETHLATVARDLEYQTQACKELERSRDDLQDEVDQSRIELQAQKTKICNLTRDSDLKDTEISTILSRLEEACEDNRELRQSRAELESQIEEINKELSVQLALSEQRELVEKAHQELQSDYEVLKKEHDFAAESLANKKYLDGFDSISDGMLGAVLVLLIAFMVFGMVTGKLA